MEMDGGHLRNFLRRSVGPPPLRTPYPRCRPGRGRREEICRRHHQGVRQLVRDILQKKHVLRPCSSCSSTVCPRHRLVKLCQPFATASREAGGLGMTATEVGFAYGTLAIIGLTVGGIIGGICASNGGLRKWIWPMALATSLNCVAYIFLSTCSPTHTSLAGKIQVCSAIIPRAVPPTASASLHSCSS